MIVGLVGWLFFILSGIPFLVGIALGFALGRRTG
jgi:hypothetical protein